MDTNALLITVIAAVAIIALVAWLILRDRRRTHLRQRFGPEYERTVINEGDRERAERELLRREKRAKSFDIRPLSQGERSHFAEGWRRIQANFVDSPALSLDEAEQLVTRLMETRGYPMANFEQMAADISVDHPRVVENFRAAREISVRTHSGVVSTEAQRQAMIHYRALFEDLLESSSQQEVEVHGERSR